ncbi:DUF4352 domain-containing protein [Streptomyces sparsogenes]|uniref:DUF4352 domain-containing protein n=1 Tax=Streptomyces sparsogenes TaxID=67365 RepID=UPI00340933E7
MRTSRYAVRAASVALLGVVLVGCSSDDGDDSKKSAPSAPDAPADATDTDLAAPKALSVGQSGDFAASDDTSEVATRFKVTVREVKYISAEEAEDSAQQDSDIYVRLRLTLENVGKHPGKFDDFSTLKWQSAKTAEQDATTYTSPPGPDLSTTYKPGQSVTGYLILNVMERGGEVTYYDAAGYGPSFVVKLPK